MADLSSILKPSLEAKQQEALSESFLLNAGRAVTAAAPKVDVSTMSKKDQLIYTILSSALGGGLTGLGTAAATDAYNTEVAKPLTQTLSLPADQQIAALQADPELAGLAPAIKAYQLDLEQARQEKINEVLLRNPQIRENYLGDVEAFGYQRTPDGGIGFGRLGGVLSGGAPSSGLTSTEQTEFGAGVSLDGSEYGSPGTGGVPAPGSPEETALMQKRLHELRFLGRDKAAGMVVDEVKGLRKEQASGGQIQNAINETRKGFNNLKEVDALDTLNPLGDAIVTLGNTRAKGKAITQELAKGNPSEKENALLDFVLPTRIDLLNKSRLDAKADAFESMIRMSEEGRPFEEIYRAIVPKDVRDGVAAKLSTQTGGIEKQVRDDSTGRVVTLTLQNGAWVRK